MDEQIRIETGEWKVCERSFGSILEKCDRCLQQLCDGKTGIYCNTDLKKPTDSLD